MALQVESTSGGCLRVRLVVNPNLRGMIGNRDGFANLIYKAHPAIDRLVEGWAQRSWLRETGEYPCGGGQIQVSPTADLATMDKEWVALQKKLLIVW